MPTISPVEGEERYNRLSYENPSSPVALSVLTRCSYRLIHVRRVLQRWLTGCSVVINPRRACAARVTVVVLCVCVCVFPWPSSATRATKRQTKHTGGLSIVFASV